MGNYTDNSCYTGSNSLHRLVTGFEIHIDLYPDIQATPEPAYLQVVGQGLRDSEPHVRSPVSSALAQLAEH